MILYYLLESTPLPASATNLVLPSPSAAITAPKKNCIERGPLIVVENYNYSN